MSELAQTVKKDDSQLPSINPKEDNDSIRDGLDRFDDQGNVLPLTHANKRKKHRKKFRKHSPQYFEQKRIEKNNKKLEQKWDSHFINDHIPDLYVKKKKSKQGKTLSKLTSEKRSITPLNPKVAGQTTGNFIAKKESLPLPRIQKPQKLPHKPITENEKAQKLPQTAKQMKSELKPPSQETEKRKRTSQQSRRLVELQKLKEKQKFYLEEYRKTLNDLHEEIKFAHCHKEALELFFEAIDKKNVRDLMDKEFSLIKKKQSLVFKVINAIANRAKFLDKINEMGLKLVENDKETLELVDHYRTSTLAVVEEILKWKETWHALYYEVFKKSKNFDFVHQTQNYLLTLSSSTDEVLQKIKKEKQNKPQTKKEKNQIEEQMSPKKEQKVEQKVKTSQSIQNKLPGQGAQKQKLPQNATSKEVKPTDIQKTKQEIPSKKDPENSKKQIVSQIQKPIIKSQTQKSFYIATSNDPFLIYLHSIAKEDKNIILKIRACELLLIEQNFNSIKK